MYMYVYVTTGSMCEWVIVKVKRGGGEGEWLHCFYIPEKRPEFGGSPLSI